MKRYDVIVIGAGLAGLQCARLLASQGAHVLLADRKLSLAEAVHTTGIFVRRTLEDFDFPQNCLGPPVRHVTLYSPGWRALKLESPHDEFRVGRMSKLYLHYLDECIRAGVEWAPATRYAGSEKAGADTLVRLETEGTRWAARARFLVGGDGANSRVARDLELDSNREWIVGVEEVFTGVPLDGHPRFHCFLDPVLAPGYLAWIVHDGEETHIGVGGYAKQFDPLRALEIFRLSVSGSIVDLSHAQSIERRGGRIPVGGVLRRIACERGLLIGDAAGAVSPLTAGGLDPCMRLSHLAARVIVDYLGSGDAASLAPYSGDAFRTRFTSRLWMRRLIAKLKQPAVLEMGCAILRLPLVNSLARHVFFGRGSFPDMQQADLKTRASLAA
ncbi:MAG: NAD(P)/FAD-dependent oxidoreductase [Pyrinomonadaceae bacterium]|nr:NAD(P)/FAD-dependent oxidoreductase [Pyrinomonadaceae bacterium]